MLQNIKMNIQKNENYVENQLAICYFLTRKGCCMMMTCLGIAIFLTLFAGNVNALSDWQVTVPEKEHVASYQIVCDDWKIHYVVNGNEYQYCLKLTQENQGKYEKASEEKTFVVLSNDKELSYQAVWNSLISSQYKYNDEVFYWLGYDE